MNNEQRLDFIKKQKQPVNKADNKSIILNQNHGLVLVHEHEHVHGDAVLVGDEELAHGRNRIRNRVQDNGNEVWMNDKQRLDFIKK